MNTNSSCSLSLSRPERRDEVRRLYFRCQLPMQRIAAKLGVSRYTVWRDVCWWKQRMPDLANPDRPHSLTEVLRKMDDLQVEAWRAWEARNEKGESRNGESGLINAITRLLAQEAKLIALVEDRAAKEKEDNGAPSVVLYLPDNGRDRLGEREMGNANRETRSGCRAVSANVSSNEPVPSTFKDGCGAEAAPTFQSASAIPHSELRIPHSLNELQQAATELQQHETACNGLNDAKANASNASMDACKTPPAEDPRRNVELPYIPGIYVNPVSGSPTGRVTESRSYRGKSALLRTNEEWLSELGGERTSLFD